MTTKEVIHLKVYLEDTDAQGIIYHANYLKYFERGRSEFLANFGYDMRDMQNGEHRFVVHEMQLKYRNPGRLGDHLEVVSTAQRSSEYRLSFDQKVRRRGEDQALVSAQVQIVCVDPEGQLIELPESMNIS